MEKTYPVVPAAKARTRVDQQRYTDLYRQSLEDNSGFWSEQARRINWIQPFSQVQNVSWKRDDVYVRWFEDGTLNACYNCIDRHLEKRAKQTAIIWEGDDPKRDLHISYRELHQRVCRMANVLKELGATRGDRITLYMPMIPEAVVAMLACARIGAVHSVVFGGFSPEALAGRIVDCQSKLVITADEGLRGGKTVPLKQNVDQACVREGVMQVLETVLVVRNTGTDIAMQSSRDHWLDELEANVADDCPYEEMNAEDPLFILYTSGSTGKPKGVLHTTGGYMVYVSFTHELVFDYQPGDIYWCTADVGWVTGHSYIVYGPLANGEEIESCDQRRIEQRHDDQPDPQRQQVKRHQPQRTDAIDQTTGH